MGVCTRACETLPRSTRAVGAWIARECGIEYQTRSGLIALPHRLGIEHRKLDPAKQAAFIKTYEDQLNHLPRRRSGHLCGCCASNPCGAAGWLLGAEGGAGRRGTEQRGGTASTSMVRSTWRLVKPS
jgi:hypothetical protein